MSEHITEFENAVEVVYDLADNRLPDYETAAYAVVDGQVNGEKTIAEWVDADPGTRQEIYAELDEEFGIDHEYATQEAANDILSWRAAGRDVDLSTRASRTFYHGVRDLLERRASTLLERALDTIEEEHSELVTE